MLEFLNEFFKKLCTKEGLLISLIICLIVFVGYRFYSKYQQRSIENEAKDQPIIEGMEGKSKANVVEATPGMKVGRTGSKLIYFDLAVGEEEVGRVKMEMFDDKVPKTCENFRGLATGHGMDSGDSGDGRVFKPYMGTIFHRVIPGFMAQGGDYENGDGTGGASIWGGKFEDENFTGGKHVGKGILSMANAGPNSNGSQFFITLGDAQHLDGKHVVFGRVVEGMDIIDKVAQIRTDDNDRPMSDIMIINCGEV